jgi:hypothetical protein
MEENRSAPPGPGGKRVAPLPGFPSRRHQPPALQALVELLRA